MKKKFAFYSAILIIFFLSGCGVLMHPRKHLDSDETWKLIHELKARNAALTTFKGIGKIKLKQDGIVQSTRLAWLACVPQKLRISLLGISGQPAASISSNGRNLYFVSHMEQKFYKKQTANPDLSSLVFVPLTFDDIIDMLAGRVPIHNACFVSVVENETDDGCVLLLKDRQKKMIEKIWLDSTRTQVTKAEFFHKNETLAYRIEWDRLRTVNSYEIPFKLSVSDNEENGFQIFIHRYWADVEIAPSRFVLSPINEK